MEEDLGPGVVAAVGELSQEEEGKLGPQSLVVVGPAIFYIYIWGFATKELESFVPAYTSSCIFSEKFRRCWREGSYVGSRTLVFLVAVICCPGHMTTQKLI